MRKILLSLALLAMFHAQAIDWKGIYPSHWWTGMKNPRLQLMLHADGIGSFTRATVQYDGVTVERVRSVGNPNYLFIDLLLAPATRPGTLTITLSGPGKASASLAYPIKARHRSNGLTRVQGVTSDDLVYLIMPDRFSNGDTSNDIVNSYRDRTCDRRNKFARHGGDFKGILDHIGYLDELGVTTLWLTPVLENDMPRMNEWSNSVAGYHGYWFTDHYQVDKRFGGNEGYRAFCDALHQRGMKVIQDAVYNHVGDHHWFVLDPPMPGWFNTSQGKKPPNHREEVFYDPYASTFDKEQMTDGWFVPHLPDLNQRNPLVATYLIQHAIWTTEEFGIDGWRVDTYKYCDEKFMNDCNTALAREFPRLTVFGESWVNTTVANAYFARNNMLTPFRHNAIGMLDFQVCFSLLAGMNEAPGWLNGVSKIYATQSNDFLYKNPMNNVSFLDNHDMDRVYSVVGEDWKKLKMGLNWLLTIRGIPQLYYGTEVLMKNKKTNTDADVREDFPGGWSDDKPKDNRFTREGRSKSQQEAFDHISKLAQFRKRSSAITTGRTMQFIPRDGLYAFFRYNAHQTILVVANTGEKSQAPDWNSMAERTRGFNQVRDVVSGTTLPLSALRLEPGDSGVYELIR